MAIAVVLGYSQAGKDTAARYMSMRYKSVKFSEPVKHNIADALGISPYDEDFKEKAMPLLLQAYEKASWVQENIWMPQIVSYARYALKSNYDIVFTDVRRSSERDAIIDLAKESGQKINLIVVSRDSEKRLESDIFLPNLVADFKQVSAVFVHIDNNGTEHELAERVRQIQEVFV